MPPRSEPSARRARVVQAHVAKGGYAIHVQAGDRVQVGGESGDFPGWWWCRAPDGREGWVPEELLGSGRPVAEMLDEYRSTELSVRVGDVVELGVSRRAWWWVTDPSGASGWVPASCLHEE